jgi:organic radical activating enzyme
MLQQDVIVALRSEFKDYYIEVETNGSFAPTTVCAKAVDLFTVSYKTKNSGNAPYELKMRNAKCVYKFVVCDKKDFKEIEAIIKKFALPKNKIYLMPEGVTREEILNKHAFVMDYCIKRGYRFSTRLHVLAWGLKRGV